MSQSVFTVKSNFVAPLRQGKTASNSVTVFSVAFIEVPFPRFRVSTIRIFLARKVNSKQTELFNFVIRDLI